MDKNLDELKIQFDSILEQDVFSSKLECRIASNINIRPIEWLWPKRLAKGKISIIAGEPGLGKSQVTAYLASNITQGADFPDGEKCSRGNVIFLSAEDDPEDTIVPRLIAAGADCSKIHIIEAVKAIVNNKEIISQFSLANDLNALEEKIKEVGEISAIFIDPISSYLGNKIDEHKNAAVRSMLTPLSKLAEKYKVAIICVTHLNKCENQKAINRVVGSIGFIAAARSAFAITRDGVDDTKRVFLPIKNNIGNDTTGLSFHIHEKTINNSINTSMIVWTNEIVKEKIDAIINTNQDQISAIEEAINFLNLLLSGGPMPATEIFNLAEQEEISNKTLRRAKQKLSIINTREGYGKGSKSLWSLSK